MTSSIFDNVGNGLCIICNIPITIAGRMTCSEKCHGEFIWLSEKEFGIIKKVVDMTTGVVYKVPTRDIIEKGVTWKDLTKYPLWEEKEEKYEK